MSQGSSPPAQHWKTAFYLFSSLYSVQRGQRRAWSSPDDGRDPDPEPPPVSRQNLNQLIFDDSIGCCDVELGGRGVVFTSLDVSVS